MEILGLCFDESASGASFRHDPALVALSFLVAAIASYTALELAERLRNAESRSERLWFVSSAIVLGSGVWSMHFIGMLAFQTPLEHRYDLGLTALSAVVAIAAAAIGFWLVRDRVGWARLIAAGGVVGIGVVSMHYMGMAALRLNAEVIYRPSLFALSVVIALGAATVALWLAFNLDRWWERIGAALVMAAAICGMHYTGMAATAIVIGEGAPVAGGVALSEPLLAATIALGVSGVVLLGLIGAFYDRQREADAAFEAERLRWEVARRTQELQVASDYLDAALKRAERESAAKSDFLASMSHELRTPMNAILGFSQLLLTDDGQPRLSPQQESAARQIEISGRHLLYLIDDILDLSKIEKGRMTFSIEEVALRPVIETVASMLTPAATEAGVTIHYALPPQDIRLKVDRIRFQQILINLVSNAIKYNRRGGEVAIRCSVTGTDARIAVRDNGAGIPAEYLQELFEPFNRLGREEAGIAGNGVGLALSKRLVEAMDGAIRVNSRPGVGSVFVLSLPLSERAAAPRQDGALQVLYVEDNPSNVLLMQHIFRQLPELSLLVATHPREGVETARRERPALILLDVNLPELDGFEVLRILRSDPATAAIPVFALTANAMQKEIDRGEAAGFTQYIIKPFEISALITLIQRTIAPRKRFRPVRAYLDQTDREDARRIGRSV